MLSGFGASLSFESEFEDQDDMNLGDLKNRRGLEDDDWHKERKVKVQWAEEGELGDSCCFGTRTVELGLDCVWKLHGGV